MAVIPLILQNGAVADANDVMSLFTEIYTNITNDNIANGASILWNKMENLPEDQVLVGDAANKATPTANLPAPVVSAIDHGSLAGIGDDDHPFYTLASGARAFLGNQSMGGNLLRDLGAPVNANDAVRKTDLDNFGNFDHGVLNGLGDDDHPQYGHLSQDEVITGTWTAPEATSNLLVPTPYPASAGSFHRDGLCKAWGKLFREGGVLDGYNIESTSYDPNNRQHTINFHRAFVNASYAIVLSLLHTNGDQKTPKVIAQNQGSFVIAQLDDDGGTGSLYDWYFVCFGELT